MSVIKTIMIYACKTRNDIVKTMHVMETEKMATLGKLLIR